MKKKNRITGIKILIGIAILIMSACQTTPTNNWTDEEKGKVIGGVYVGIDGTEIQSLMQNKEKIAKKVLDKCISKYPNFDDFKSNYQYSSEAFKEVLKEESNSN
jgi:formaldehyde-activating enzyme involved in methanogenesis